jgi:peptidoglycan hydrolase-like protein with peptidoglycan-binding domain
MSKFVKTLVAFSAVALVLGVALAPAPAAAQTAAELQALIASLQQQIAALTAQLGGSNTGSGGTTFNFTRDLTLGSTGEDVRQLQQFLNSKGFSVAASGAGSPGMESTYFGNLTKSALAAFQAANGINPPVGYFGPITRSAISLMVPVGSGTGTGTGTGTGSTGTTLSGGAGSINDVDYVSGINNEEVGEGEDDQEVAGIRIEADDGSDIEITAVNLNFSKSTGATSDFRKYADEVSIWLDDEELARLDGDEFTDDNGYDKTVTLDLGGVIDAGEKGDLVVKVSGINNMDSADEGDTWTLEFESVRFRDGSGAIISDSSTGDINDATGRSFTFNSFAAAADVELKAAKSSDSPDSQVINVDDTNDTDDVELLVFTLEAKGSDIEIKDLPINFATSTGGTATTLAHVASAVYLEIDGTKFSELSSAAVVGASGATVTFDDIDMTIDEGDKVTVRVLADIEDTGANFVDGDQLTASYTASNRASADIEDETGEDLPDADKTGTALGDALAFYDVGIMVTNFSTSASVATDDGNNDDTGTFKISFTVEAFDGTVYVSTSTTATTQTTAPAVTTDNTYIIALGGTATTSTSDIVDYTTSDGASLTSSVGNLELGDGESTDIEIIVTRTNTGPTNAGLYQLLLKGIGWATTDIGSGYNNYRFDLEDVKTSPASLD